MKNHFIITKRKYLVIRIISYLLVIILIVAVFGYLYYRHEKNIKFPENLHIPELGNYNITKGLIYENDSLVSEFVTTIDPTSEPSHYNILKFKNVQNNFESLLQPYENDFKYSLSNMYKININDAHESASHIDFKYRYSRLPVSKTTSSDTLFIQKFERGKVNISLDEKNTKDVVIRMLRPFTLVFYKKNNDLYLITAEQVDIKGKKWIDDEELQNITYLLVKNWGVYDTKSN